MSGVHSLKNFLTDNWGRKISYLRLSVTDRCNLRCKYCMPPQGVDLLPRSEILTYGELEILCKILIEHGIEKIRITGGEPLVRKGLCTLLKKLKGIGRLKELCLTTNGVLLKEMVHELRSSGIDRINISLDSLDSRVYQSITSYPYLHKVLEGISAALEEGLAPLKINVVVMRGTNHEEIADFVEMARENPINVRFIEHMPFGTKDNALFYPAEEILRSISRKYQIIPKIPSSPTAMDYHVEGFRGWVSIIAPISKPFCNYCNRLRITAKGELRLCLLDPKVIDLKGPLREGWSTQKLSKLIREAVAQKPERHTIKNLGEHFYTMVHIGG